MLVYPEGIWRKSLLGPEYLWRHHPRFSAKNSKEEVRVMKKELLVRSLEKEIDSSGKRKKKATVERKKRGKQRSA